MIKSNKEIITDATDEALKYINDFEDYVQQFKKETSEVFNNNKDQDFFPAFREKIDDLIVGLEKVSYKDLETEFKLMGEAVQFLEDTDIKPGEEIKG